MQQTVEINNKNEREKRTARRGAPGAAYSSFVHEIAGRGKGNRHRTRKPFADEEIPQIIGRHQIENLPTIFFAAILLYRRQRLEEMAEQLKQAGLFDNPD